MKSPILQQATATEQQTSLTFDLLRGLGYLKKNTCTSLEYFLHFLLP